MFKTFTLYKAAFIHMPWWEFIKHRQPDIVNSDTIQLNRWPRFQINVANSIKGDGPGAARQDDKNSWMRTARRNVGNSHPGRLKVACNRWGMRNKWHAITSRVPAAANEEPRRISTTSPANDPPPPIRLPPTLDAVPGGPTGGSAANCGSNYSTSSDGCVYFLFR